MQSNQSLKGSIGGCPFDGAYIPAWGIKSRHRWMKNGPAPVGVEAFAVQVIPFALHIKFAVGRRGVQITPDSIWLVGHHTWTSHFLAE